MTFPHAEKRTLKHDLKHVISYLLVTLVAALFVTPASAQVAAGLNEAGGRGNIEYGGYSGEDKGSVLDLNMFYGRFVTDRIVIGPAISIYRYDGSTTGSINAYSDFHFGDVSRSLIPYVGVGAGKFLNGGDNKPTFVAFGPGVKMFVGQGGGAFTAQAMYRRQFMDADLNDGASGSNEFVLSIGVSGFFGR
jgi:hypothetical protein